MKVVIIGAGTTAVMAAEILLADPNISLTGFVGTEKEAVERKDTLVFGGLPFLGSRDVLPALRKNSEVSGFVSAIGDNAVRESAFYDGQRAGLESINVISRNASVSRFATLGDGIIIGHGVVVGAGATVGRNCIIESGTVIEVDAVVEDNCYLGPGVTFCGGRIGRNCHIGAGTTIGPYVNVGRNQTFSFGEVIRESVKDNPRTT